MLNQFKMLRSYVAIDDPVHRMLSQITRQTRLVPARSHAGRDSVEYQIDAQQLPDSYFSLAMLHTLGGVPHDCMRELRWSARQIDRANLVSQVGYFDATRLDRRCSRDLRLRVCRSGPGPLAAELLSFGTGMLRAGNDDPAEPLHRHLWTQFGRIGSHYEQVHAAIRALHHMSTKPVEALGKETFYSTNVIYGDTFGELLQLWDRRADMEFLDLYAAGLKSLRKSGEIVAHLNPPENLEAIMHLHLQRQRVWRQPPSGGRGLLRRLEFILDRIRLDRKIQTHFSPDSLPKQGVVRRQLRQPNWNSDHSGYDGWLQP